MNIIRSFYVFGLLVLLPSITFANEPPVAGNINKTIQVVRPTKISLKGKDPEGKPLTYTLTKLAERGDLILNGATITYTFSGGSSKTDSFQYTVNDGEFTSAPATVNLKLVVKNRAPYAQSQDLIVQMGSPSTIALIAGDADEDPLTYRITAKPKRGKLKLNGNMVIYTPNAKNANFQGRDKFNFKAKDRKKLSATAQVKLTITANCPAEQEFKNGVCVNSPPVCVLPQVLKDDVCVTPPPPVCLLPLILKEGVCTAPAANQGTLEVAKSGVGKVTSTPAGIDCGATCTAFFNTGATITLTATPETNYSFSGWEGGCTGTEPTCSLTQGALTKVTAKFTFKFPTAVNDTGITQCANATQNGLSCPLADFPGQDGDSGLDKTDTNDSNGLAGFNFSKIGANGQVLEVQNALWDDNGSEAAGTKWSCVKDNVTGLMWERKTDDGSLHDIDWTYSWYELDNTKNGGSAGVQNAGVCEGSPCDTAAYVQAVNAAGWCGHKDWRMPTPTELQSLISFSKYDPAIDTGYFPFKTGQNNRAWTSMPVAYETSEYVWRIPFTSGYQDWGRVSEDSEAVWLVSSGH